jgi:hypothetical protein
LRFLRAAKLPAGPDRMHEIKHDGYRLQVRRNATLRLFARLLSGFLAISTFSLFSFSTGVG